MDRQECPWTAVWPEVECPRGKVTRFVQSAESVPPPQDCEANGRAQRLEGKDVGADAGTAKTALISHDDQVAVRDTCSQRLVNVCSLCKLHSSVGMFRHHVNSVRYRYS